ncbi:acyltransferase family protein [Mesorhizobium sp. NZP2077]|uniref:acyltransferase family protein n=1 Tax=Mesorhizobium sp. NZP2077 TaxID=2483404 RepID=UPI0015529F44|nr:acyltransferase family protein [Mesorhizobium sp. NZP2077]QKC85289.1 acyltransferase [Mesorhizobium sp. NZP2077]QKD18928.1 acyltransferase [Mesorhizobium sp. NZP2077]
MVFSTIGTVSFASRVNAEYDPAAARTAQAKRFWYNPQLLRLISAYAIAYIHMAGVVSAAHVDPAVLSIFRFGTDLFVVMAGFLTAHVLGNNGKSAGTYLRTRLIRIVPLYWGFTVLAFLVENYAMKSHPKPLSELFMSLAFVPYGPYPILYPTWTLLVIVEFSLIIAAFQLVSVKYGIFYSATFAVFLAAAGHTSGIENPIFVFYTNPILIDFALGIIIFKLANSGPFPFKLPWHGAVAVAAAAVAFGAVAAVLRPFFWPALPRVLALGLPMSLLLLGTVALEQLGVYSDSKLVNFLAKCTYSIYLTHWFVDVVSEKLVAESGGSARLATVLLFVAPVAVTCVSVLVYLYGEVPLTRYLSDRFPGPERKPA